MTSFSDVMTVKETGERTFFHNRGACRLFDETNLHLEELDAELVCSGTADFWMPLMPAMKNTGRHLPERFMI